MQSTQCHKTVHLHYLIFVHLHYLIPRPITLSQINKKKLVKNPLNNTENLIKPTVLKTEELLVLKL